MTAPVAPVVVLPLDVAARLTLLVLGLLDDHEFRLACHFDPRIADLGERCDKIIHAGMDESTPLQDLTVMADILTTYAEAHRSSLRTPARLLAAGGAMTAATYVEPTLEDARRVEVMVGVRVPGRHRYRAAMRPLGALQTETLRDVAICHEERFKRAPDGSRSKRRAWEIWRAAEAILIAREAGQ